VRVRRKVRGLGYPLHLHANLRVFVLLSPALQRNSSLDYLRVFIHSLALSVSQSQRNLAATIALFVISRIAFVCLQCNYSDVEAIRLEESSAHASRFVFVFS
jgi:hypothetical protein